MSVSVTIRLAALSSSLDSLAIAGAALVGAVGRQLAMPGPADEPLDAVAHRLARVERLARQAAQVAQHAAGQAGAAVVAREALRRRLRAVDQAAEALAFDARSLDRDTTK
jgi:hypothetical protein